MGYVPAERLQREIMYKHLAGLPVGIFTEVTPIAFVGVPTCEAVSTYNNNGRVEQTTLRFKTLDDVPTNRHIAFVITDCNGQSYVIGQHEKPRPIIKTTSTTGTPENHTPLFYIPLVRGITNLNDRAVISDNVVIIFQKLVNNCL